MFWWIYGPRIFFAGLMVPLFLGIVAMMVIDRYGAVIFAVVWTVVVVLFWITAAVIALSMIAFVARRIRRSRRYAQLPARLPQSVSDRTAEAQSIPWSECPGSSARFLPPR